MSNPSDFEYLALRKRPQGDIWMLVDHPPRPLVGDPTFRTLWDAFKALSAQAWDLHSQWREPVNGDDYHWAVFRRLKGRG